MPLPFFNVNRPTDLNAIDSYINAFASPEAAERATPLGGASYLRDQYHVLTGDAFANPFEEAKQERAKALIEAATHGASVAVGSNTGSRLLSQPDLPTAPTTTPVAAPINTMGQPLSNSSNRTVQNSLITSMLQERGNRYKLAGTDMLLTEPKANNYLDVLEKRANLSGAGDLWRQIYRSNPEIFSQGTASDDPRFARVQGGKEGKIEAADALHPIAMDPTFVQEARRNPERAKALYAAVTNGRDYTTDIAGKSQLLAEQRDSRKKIIESIKNVEADPISGDLFKVVETKDLGGNIQQQRVPLNPMDKSAIEAEGGFKRIYGIDLPNRGGLPALTGMTPQEHAQYRERTQQVIKSNPSISVAEASKLAHRQLYEEQQRNVATLQSPQSTGRPGIVRAADTLGQFMTGAVNKVVKGNPLDLMMGTPSRPYEVPTNEQLDQSWENVSANPSVDDVATQTKRYWMEKLGITIPLHGSGGSW